MSDRPNVLWIMGDEFRTDSLSCYGTPFPAVATPNIDRIARSGVRFTNCFCNSPICVPSRTSEMTANPPEATAVYGNEGSWKSYPYDRDLVTFPEHFAANGYRTVNFGKTHLPVAVRPWQVDEHVGADLATFFDGVDEEGQRQGILTPTLKAAIGGTFPGPVEFPGNRLTRRAAEWLRTDAVAGPPFLARVSFLQPHSPVMPPPPYDALYRDLPWPERIEGEAASDYERRFAEVVGAHALSPGDIRRVHSDYHGLVRWLDDQIGQLLAALEESGLIENTVIVLEADHGVSLGECGRLQKHTFAPETHRVPRLISWPGRLPAGEVRADLTELMDLARTLCGLCGVEPAASFRGRDVFREPAPPHVFGTIGYGLPHSFALPNQNHGNWFDGTGWPRRSCVRTDRYRLDLTVRKDGAVTRPGEDDPFLADVALDPLERVNRASDPLYAGVLAELSQLLRAQAATAVEPAFVPRYSAEERGIN